MPKKFKGENSKAAEARARKTAQKDAEEERKQKQLEDQYWQEDDKNVLKKLQRKDEKEKKKIDQLERKKEIQKLADEELASIKPVKLAPPIKVTRAAVEIHCETMVAATAAAAASVSRTESVDEQPLKENVNRFQFEGEARTVDEAIQVLSVGDDAVIDMHPEKRLKAAYTAFEEKQLPLLKLENPNLRLSQLKQMLKKDWNRSPDNPLNQRLKTQ